MIDVKSLSDQELDQLALNALHEVRIRAWRRGWDKGVQSVKQATEVIKPPTIE